MVAGKVPRLEQRYLLISHRTGLSRVVINAPGLERLKTLANDEYGIDTSFLFDGSVFFHDDVQHSVVRIPAIPSFTQAKSHVTRQYMNADCVMVDSYIAVDGTHRVVEFKNEETKESYRIEVSINESGELSSRRLS